MHFYTLHTFEYWVWVLTKFSVNLFLSEANECTFISLWILWRPRYDTCMYTKQIQKYQWQNRYLFLLFLVFSEFLASSGLSQIYAFFTGKYFTKRDQLRDLSIRILCNRSQFWYFIIFAFLCVPIYFNRFMYVC